MPIARVADDLEMHYVVDDYTDPWSDSETVLMLHGSSESGAMWFGWVPHLARHFRVVRPDMRGFGASSPMPRDFPWTLDAFTLGQRDPGGDSSVGVIAAWWRRSDQGEGLHAIREARGEAAGDRGGDLCADQVEAFDAQLPGEAPVQTPPSPQPAPPPAPAPQAGLAPGGTPSGMWYYCESARAYYPYVNECREAWRAVPATPPQQH